MYRYDQRPATRFDKLGRAALDAIKAAEYAVLVGRNNCGKSFILKSLTQEIGDGASYLGPARYQNFNLLGYFTPSRDRRTQRYAQFMSQWRQDQQNIDNSPLNLQQAIAELSDSQRDKLREIMRLLLGADIEFLQTVPNNSMSQRYVAPEGHNISYTSSGFRLISTLVTSLLDEDYSTFLIDEPELGISPEAQGLVADFLFDRDHRAKYFGHIKTLVLATHSTIFLDRKRLGNNYVVSKSGDEISVKSVPDQAEFNRIHFFLLGNRFETLYLPSLIVVVEGKTDHAFIQRVLGLRHPQAQFSVINATSDSRIREVIHLAKSLLTDIQRSPYRDRILVVLDSVHGGSLQESLVSMGLPRESIVVWTQNGVEHLYPPRLLDNVFGEGGDLSIEGDLVSRNGRTYSKADLADRITALLTADTIMAPEFEERFMTSVAGRLG